MSSERDEFWRTFLERSQGLTRPCLFPGFFESPACSEEELADVLRDARSRHLRGLDIRVYVGDGESYEHAERVLSCPPEPGEGIRAWAARVFGEQKFGIILSSAEAVSEVLARRYAAFLRPLLAQAGFRYDGIALSFFIGNYDHTPFGIHNDPLMWLIHGHVGPGSKDMYVWDAATYEANWGSHDFCHEPEKMLSCGQKFTLDPGALFYFPGRYYHIGKTAELSIGLVIILPDVARKALLLRALEEGVDDLLQRAPAVAGEVRLRDDGSSLEDLLTGTGLPLAWETPAHEWLGDRIAGFRLLSRSNMGLHQPPCPVDIPSASLARGKIAVVRSFELFHASAPDRRLVVFVRGRRVFCEHHDAVIALLERLNEGQPVAVEEAVQGLRSSLGEAGALEFVAQLVRYRGVDFTPEG